MKRIFWYFVTFCVTVGVIAALTVPSLLRYRVSGPTPEPGPYALSLYLEGGGEYTPSPQPQPSFESSYNYIPPVVHNTEDYDPIHDSTFKDARLNPLSTFSIDVDTASYSNVRRFLELGSQPPADAVRIEELINYFQYDYPQPDPEHPFSIVVEAAACPWKPEHRLVHIGLQGRTIPEESVPPRNLVFLLDVSGSMDQANKLPLLQASMRLLTKQLRQEDRVAIVVYAGAAGLVLPSTAGADKRTISRAIDSLRAGGSTAGGQGIQLAYEVAAESFIEGGINRVILATDGDFNVGISSRGGLEDLIEDRRESGIFLTVLGFGVGNLKDATMELLADKGNGNYAYIDSHQEAEKVLVREVGATLMTIAKDVKIQVEFNPAKVSAYRLVGYENRLLAAEDFNDDKKDAGELGAGHTVTALYEVVPVGVELDTGTVDPLKYQEVRRRASAANSSELLTVKLRYKQPDALLSTRLELPLHDDPNATKNVNDNMKFSAAVAAFGMLLRDSEYKGEASFDMVLELARESRGDDPHGDRAEFLKLVTTAKNLS